MMNIFCTAKNIWKYAFLVAAVTTGLQGYGQCPGNAALPFDAARGGVVATSGAFLSSTPGSVYVQDGGLDNNDSSTLNIQGDVYINGDMHLGNNSGITIQNGGRLFVYGNVYVDSGSALTINTGGNLYFYGEQWVSKPGAVINNSGGAGTVSYVMPRQAPGANDPVSGSNRFPGNATAYTATNNALQFLDGGGVTMNINLAQRNANNISLCNLDNSTATGSGNTRLSGTLTFSVINGDILLNGNDFVLTSTGNYAYNAVNPYAGFFVTNGTGNVVKEAIAGSTAFTFPVGQAEGDYTPATITNTSGGANDYSVQVKNYANSGAVIATPSEGMDRTWRIFSGSGGQGNICLSHNTATNPAGAGTNGSLFNNTSAFVTQQTASGTWSTGTQTDGGSPVSTHCALYTLAANPTAVTSFFTKSSDLTSPLPVALVRFEGTVVHCNAHLTWETATEINSSKFVVQYSREGRDFVPAGTVQSRNSPTGASYEFDYNGLPTGTSYFRLQLQDVDNRLAYSPVVVLQSGCSGEISIVPNPARDVLNIKGLAAGNQVLIVNIVGQQLIRTIASGPTLRIDVGEWPSGLYTILIADNNKALKTGKIVKQ